MKKTMLHKKIVRPIWRYIYRLWSQDNYKRKTFSVQIGKLLRGGHNGIRAAKYAELTGNFLLPSTSVFDGAHVKLLQLYNEIGDEVLTDKILENTEYYKEAVECMKLTGSFFYDRPEKIKILAERFIRQHRGEKIDLSLQPGQSLPDHPIFVRQVKHSSCYEVIDGNHRIARAIMRGDESIPVFIYEKEPALTPLQQLLLDCLWINKRKWLYQPVNSPELTDEWTLVRRCTDRLQMMSEFLQKNPEVSQQSDKSYIDIGSSYGWFVNEMSRLGYQSFGMDRDPFGIEVGFHVYGLKREQIIHSDLVFGLEKLLENKMSYNVVSCLSVLHHFVLGKSSISAESFIKLLDNITDKILFLDTGEEHEQAFEGALNGWNVNFIKQWIKTHTSFKEVIPLGVDQDCKKPFEGYYNRTLFACIK
ncbi:MAG: hypothetical protein ACOH2E_01440 [Candidatus Paracaedibacter sp.]